MASSLMFERWNEIVRNSQPSHSPEEGRVRGQGAIAAMDSQGEHSFESIDRLASTVARALLNGRHSLEGARVALLVKPGARFIASLIGVWRAGGCAVILSPLHPPAESAYFCQDAKVRQVIVSQAWAPGIPAISADLEYRLIEKLEADTALETGSEPAPEAIVPQAGDPALQIYTSGTTGKPKGAVLTHANLGIQQELLAEAWELSSDDTLLHVLPLHHIHGLCIAMLSVLGKGGKVRFIAPFDPRRVWNEMGESTVLMAVPTVYSKLLGALDAAGDSERERWIRGARQLRLSTSGSAALPVTLAARWRELTGDIPLERFGMTELGVALSNPLRGTRKAGTVGKPLRTVETRIVDEKGQDAQVGELWVAGPSVFAGYFERPEATEKSFALKDGVRFFRTGDTVTLDEDGYFRILGRTSVDILKSGGYKLSALEIEEALREHPSVAEVAIVGVPDETWGDRVVACVVPRPGRHCTEELLREFAKTRLANYKVPKSVVFLAELPRNAMGKVVKPDLVKRLTKITPRLS